MFASTKRASSIIKLCLTAQMSLLLVTGVSMTPAALAGANDSTSLFSPATRAEPAINPTQTDNGLEQKSVRSTSTKLSLEDAINLALAANRGLADSADRVEGARLTLVSAEAEFELKFLPDTQVNFTDLGEDSVGTGIAIEKKFSTGTEMSVAPGTEKIGSNYRTAVNTQLTQPLLRGLSREFNLASVHQAEFSTRSARRSLYLTQVDTVLSTITGVYDVIRQRELLRLNEESAQRLRGHAEAARAKEKIGLATPIDAYRAGIEMNQAEDNLSRAHESYGDAVDNLKVLLSLPLAEDIEVEAQLTYDLVRMSEDNAVKVAFANRVELDQAADTIREAKRQSRVAKHNVRPDLDVVLSYSWFGRGESFGESTSLDQNNWGMGVQASTDLARTAERAGYDQSLLNVRTARRNETLRRDEVVREVKRELRNLNRSEQRITIQEEQIRQARGKLELARVRFRWGLANNFDLIEAETELRRAQTDLLSAVLDYIVGSHRFRAAMGTLLERPERF